MVPKYVKVDLPKDPNDRQLAIAAYRAMDSFMFYEYEDGNKMFWESSTTSTLVSNGVTVTLIKPNFEPLRKEYGVTKEDIVRCIPDVKYFLELTGLYWGSSDTVTSERCRKLWRKEDKLFPDRETIYINSVFFQSGGDLMDIIRRKDPDYVLTEKEFEEEKAIYATIYPEDYADIR